MRPKLFPEVMLLRLPAGTLARLHTTARERHTTAAQYARQLVASGVAPKPTRRPRATAERPLPDFDALPPGLLPDFDALPPLVELPDLPPLDLGEDDVPDLIGPTE